MENEINFGQIMHSRLSLFFRKKKPVQQQQKDLSSLELPNNERCCQLNKKKRKWNSSVICAGHFELFWHNMCDIEQKFVWCQNIVQINYSIP